MCIVLNKRNFNNVGKCTQNVHGKFKNFGNINNKVNDESLIMLVKFYMIYMKIYLFCFDNVGNIYSKCTS